MTTKPPLPKMRVNVAWDLLSIVMPKTDCPWRRASRTAMCVSSMP